MGFSLIKSLVLRQHIPDNYLAAHSSPEERLDAFSWGNPTESLSEHTTAGARRNGVSVVDPKTGHTDHKVIQSRKGTTDVQTAKFHP